MDWLNVDDQLVPSQCLTPQLGVPFVVVTEMVDWLFERE